MVMLLGLQWVGAVAVGLVDHYHRQGTRINDRVKVKVVDDQASLNLSKYLRLRQSL